MAKTKEEKRKYDRKIYEKSRRKRRNWYSEDMFNPRKDQTGIMANYNVGDRNLRIVGGEVSLDTGYGRRKRGMQ